MRVELAAEVFSADGHVEHVMRLLVHFQDGRHEWIVHPDTVAAFGSYSQRHYPSNAGTYTEFARSAAVHAAAYATGKARRPVRIGPEDLADSAADLDLPAYLVVENHHSDGCFIRAIATVFGARDVLTALDRGWLELDHGGGQGDIQPRALLRWRRFNGVKRVAALVDSDRMAPNVQGKGDQLAKRLREHGVTVHALKFREAENYVPNRVLATTRRQDKVSRQLNALKRLTSEQRAHFDMKNGFRNGVPKQQQDLYANVSDHDRAGLRNGFGGRILDAFAAHAAALREDSPPSSICEAPASAHSSSGSWRISHTDQLRTDHLSSPSRSSPGERRRHIGASSFARE